ncbi:MAG: hypothetical protein H7070_12940 [Saprospiraceae bacterium]|nr:hypothetical protein [Pyrinomonadaceae bacterium]
MNIKPEGNYVMQLLALLDGSRDRADLAVAMAKLFENDGVPRTDYEKELRGSIDKVLSQLASIGLLVK